jgi:Tfp pilus assembly protein PilV
MEVVVAASVLAITVLAILSGLDASARSSSDNRQRTVASALAEQDLERMRGMKVADLSGYANTAPATVGGVKYTVNSNAQWVNDGTGAAASCADDGSSPGTYLQISSSVQAAQGARTAPVTLTSLMAPPVGAGSLAVRVRSAADQPVSNATITISGPAPHDTPPDNSVVQTGKTNATGCVVFGFLPTGTYTVQMTDAGWVDMQGNSPATTEQGVRPATISTATLIADRAASVTVRVQTKPFGSATFQDDYATVIQAANVALQPEGLKAFTVGSPRTSIGLTPLFPFTAGYTLYSGCKDSDPTKVGSPPNTTYFSNHPEAVATPAPGGSASATVIEPALNIKVTRNGSNYRSARVVVTSLTCGGTTTFNAGRSSTGLSPSYGLPSPGPGMPFGHYQLCADDGSRYVQVADVDDTNEDGTPLVTLNIDTSGPGRSPSGTC